MNSRVRPAGRWDAALRVVICSDIAYMAAVVDRLAHAMADSIYMAPGAERRQIADCIVYPTGHERYRALAGCVVKLGDLETRFDDREAALAFVAEVRASQREAA